MKRLTLKWLQDKDACKSGIEYYKTLNSTNTVHCLRQAVNDKRYVDCIWVIKKALKHKDLIRFSIFCAEQVIEIYEAKYPDNKAPQEAIKAAKAVLKKDTAKNRSAAARAAARAAYAAARAAAYAAYAAADAADAAYAAYAAYAAADAADAAYAADAADAAYAADAAADAAYAAADAARAADGEMRSRCINYAIALIEGVK